LRTFLISCLTPDFFDPGDRRRDFFPWMLPHWSIVAALKIFRCRQKFWRRIPREVREGRRGDQFSVSRHVAVSVLYDQVKMAAFINVIEKGKSSGEKQHSDRGKKAKADHPPKFIRTR